MKQLFDVKFDGKDYSIDVEFNGAIEFYLEDNKLTIKLVSEKMFKINSISFYLDSMKFLF